MSVSLHSLATQTFTPLMKAFLGILDKAEAHAAEKGFNSRELVEARLAPDMYPLSKQVQIFTDHAKFAMARLSGSEAPVFEDTETTIAELKTRIARALDYVASVPASAFEGAGERQIVIPIPNADIEIAMNGEQYLRDWAFGNFYFHVVTGYDILRHKGVVLGKQDFLASVGAYIRPKVAAG